MKQKDTLKIYKITSCFLGFILSLITATANGQDPYDPLKVISPSPTAASLGTYANNPVNYYSGTVGVSIPLYDIKTSSNALSIGLQYYSTGVKVADNASWVGLGWSLSCGGVITKTVRGKDDLFGTGSSFTGYYNAGAIPPVTDLLGSDGNVLNSYDQTYFSSFYQGYTDTDPDVFNYNFGNYTGKFCLGKLADGSPIYLDQQNGIKLVYVQSTDSWVATDPMGYKYYLGTQEKAQDFNVYSKGYESADDLLIGDNSSSSNNLTTSWYLDQIVAPTGEIVQFTYQKPSQSKSLISKSEQEYDAMNALFGFVNAFGVGPNPQAVYHQYSASQQVIQDVNLKQITFANGSITFNTTDRDDIEYIGTGKPQKLSEIVINDNQNNLIKKYTLNYIDFLSPATTTLSNDYTNRRRLALQSVVETGNDGKTKPPYSLTYFNPNNIPYKFSKATDHWGYYNGQTTNTTLLPPKVIISGNVFQSFPGANRKPDPVDSDLLCGILSSITYPTGGSSSFTYELNDYANLKGDDQYSLQAQYAIANSITSTYTVSFDIAPIDTVGVIFQSNFKEQGDVSYVGDYSHIYKDGTPIYQFSETTMQPQGSFYSHPQTTTLVLTPGHYTMDVRNITGVTTSISASWNHKVPVAKQKGGGLRISSITNYQNSNSIASFKKILYTKADGTSSGRLTSPQLYDFILPDFAYLCRLANSFVTPGLNSNIGVIGYSKVTELEGANGENGKTEYYYHNTDDVVDSHYMMNVPSIHDPLNGKLEEKIIYNAAGQVIEKTGYQYQLQLYQTTSLTGLTRTPLLPGYGITDYLPTLTSAIKSFLRYYKMPSYWVVKTAEADTLYDRNQNATISNNRYYYNNPAHRNVTASELTKSNGNTFGTSYTYSQDYLPGTTFINDMVAANIVSTPIEAVKYQIDGSGSKTILDGTIKTYKAGGKGLLDQVQMLESNQPINSTGFNYSYGNYTSPTTFTPDSHYNPRLTENNYDSYGNLLSQYKTNGVHLAYQWGYNGQYPVAAATNTENNNIFYDSFEEGNGNSGLNDSKTGHYSHLSAYSKALTGLDAGNYTLSYWQKVSGAWSFVKMPITVSGNTYTISLNAQIDDIRFYPANAQMTTYTYDPLVGMTSMTDAKGEITTYEYDNFQRLMNMKDKDGNIVKRMDYHYQGQ
ncbi:hypothetical protein G7092_24570 [Mucilaginibacter sp. HC2]|uniref:hypothetical protein n=1 Tax=Mucilaginibacter inviolabilis TaxID=2714892 RepID=UPI00140C5661|nr:hypothetical protein [Mucilaginibacter inviolabilis]NHA06997.1 hypothetical protein [Mucilaginibacter inviolabilis]